MPRTKTSRQRSAVSARTDPFQLREPEEAAREAERLGHVYGPGIVCDTEKRGYATPDNRSPLEIVVDASEGLIPLWEKNTTLRWRFRERSLRSLRTPELAQAKIKELLGEAILAWGDASPVNFSQDEDTWDFEIVVRESNECTTQGCVLASAFFPDTGRHKLTIYPKMFSQDRKEQIDTLIHEIGHAFGLRHFFANVSEIRWPSEVFGAHKPFTIMNYGNQSELTSDDKSDLRNLYQTAWSGALTNINGTPIRFVKPFHTISSSS